MKKIILFFLLAAGIIYAQGQTADLAKYKSMFTLNFMRYIGWPDNAKDGDFVIGVLKNSTMANDLKTMTQGKKFGFQNIVIKEFKNIEDITECQMLYVDGNVNFSKNAEVISQKLGKKNSLIITDNKGAIASGSMINFVITNNQLKFEVSAENAEKSGLKLSNTLLSMNNAIRS